MNHLFILMLIPLCALFNHEGGQSTVIPDPRVTARMIFPGLAFGLMSWLVGVSFELAVRGGLSVIAGLTCWAVWPWAQGFMCFTGQDSRNYKKLKWLCQFCDKIIGTTPQSILTQAQCKWWGFIYMTVRGLFMYPMFILLAILFTPWALLIGLSCILQGFIYSRGVAFGAYAVVVSEWVTGAVMIGAPLALTLKLYVGG